MLHFHFCKKYQDNVTLEIDSAVRNRIKQIEKRNDLQGVMSFFTGGVYVLHTMKPSNMRTIVQKETVNINNEGLEVYFVHYITDHQDLKTHSEIKKGLWAKYHPISESDKQDFIENYQKSQSISNNEIKQPLPERLKTWLNDYRINIKCDIYETAHWAEFATSNSLEDGMPEKDIKSYFYVLKNVINGNDTSNNQVLKKYDYISLEIQTFENYEIIYKKIQISNSIYYLLLCGSNHKQEVHREQMREKFKQETNVYQNIDDISKDAIRAYPSWIIKNSEDDLWMDIQKNSETSNLSLLAEQTDFLREFRFPKYIDAQAGSGKSTMLYYLFANAYYYKCAGEINGNIIFLTENETLLDSTKKAVRGLLQHNPEFASLSQVDILDIDEHFSTLKNFLIALLEEQDNSKFDINKYLDFSLFKLKYDNSPRITQTIKNSYTPEFYWFVINTYIRGFDINEEVTSQNYNKITKGNKDKISEADLKYIEKNVLPFYNDLLEKEGYWDKIKVIKYIKENNITVTTRYQVLFCDEAQDFSKVELDFILNLSEYLQYDCGSFNKIPIVFAGDALQTVNPTGFRKEDIKDLFYNQLNANLKENEYKPQHNYRSTQAIVNIANSVQWFRRKELGAKIEYPQKAKQREDEHDAYHNYYLSYDILDNYQTKCLENLEYKTIIVPCNAEEKLSFIENNPFLNAFKQFANRKIQNGIGKEDAEKTENLIKSAVEAKGLDYQQVIIYGFGAYCLKKLGQYTKINSESYDTQYFFNKLYVAVTRAQEELIIIDSMEAFSDFWQPLIKAYATSDFKESSISEESISNSILQADETTRFEKGTPDMALENAKKDKERATFEYNPTLMRMAASQFLRLGHKKEYFECKAKEYEIGENYQKAGEQYEKVEGGLENAAKMYWKGKIFDKILPLTKSLPNSTEQYIRQVLIEIYQNETIKSDDARFLLKNKSVIHELLNQINWKDELLEKIKTTGQAQIDDENRKSFIDILNYLNENKSLNETIALLQYKIKRYSDAINTWDEIQKDDTDLYAFARSEVAKNSEEYETYIYWLGRLTLYPIGQDRIEKENKEIIKAYENNRSELNTPKYFETYLFIASAYLQYKPLYVDILTVIKKAEQECVNRREYIVEQYRFLLNTDLSEAIFNFILERWAKNSFITGSSVEQINQEYKEIAKNSQQIFIPFTKDDMESLGNLPEYIIPKRSEHITNITINNFKKFQNLNIQNLGLINLIVGDNNIGKTSLLEAFLFTEDKKDYLKRLAFAYIDRRNIATDKEEVNGQVTHFYNMNEDFLIDFKSYNSQEFNLQFTFTKARNFWKYNVTQENKENEKGVQPIIFNESDYNVLHKLNLLDTLSSPFMPYGKGFGNDLAQAYSDEIGAKGRSAKKEFYERMKLFIPNIEEIDTDTKGGIFIYENTSDDKRNPLHQYGEGANKIFRILLLLSLHKGNRLMIDEIDAGIHYSRFKEFWKVILLIAKKDNTQIIATTHNEECINYFTEVLEELGSTYKEDARVIQCENVANQLRVRSYDFDNFSLAAELGIDIRGEAQL